MNAKLQLIINAINLQIFEGDEDKSIQSNYEAAYEAMVDYAKEVDYEGFEVVDGEFSNHYSHLFAQSKDNCEYECDGEIIDRNTKSGTIIADFLDLSGNIVFVRYNEEAND